MKTNKYIQDKIDDTLNSINAINDVKVSPFFKDKTLNVLFSENEIQQTGWSWFTPKLQLATLVCFFALNIYAFMQINSTSYDDNISDFAELHDLNISENTTLLTETYED